MSAADRPPRAITRPRKALFEPHPRGGRNPPCWSHRRHRRRWGRLPLPCPSSRRHSPGLAARQKTEEFWRLTRSDSLCAPRRENGGVPGGLNEVGATALEPRARYRYARACRVTIADQGTQSELVEGHRRCGGSWVRRVRRASRGRFSTAAQRWPSGLRSVPTGARPCRLGGGGQFRAGWHWHQCVHWLGLRRRGRG